MSTYSIQLQPALQMLFSERLPIYVSHDLRWNNRTTRYNCRFAVTSLALHTDFLGRNNRTTHYDIYNVLFSCSARENLQLCNFLNFIVVEHIQFFHGDLQMVFGLMH